MCGIWAVFGSQVNVSIQCHAAHTISHRGPDCFRIENIIHVENCCLAFHRLAIIEDNCGMQPMTLSTKPHVHLMYNGEIYNHKLLAEAHSLQVMTHLDGEPIIHLYDKLGPQAMAAHLDGVFAFCILDTIKRKVIIGRDTFGIRPLFKIHTDQGFLAICSEVKGLFGLSHSHSDHDVKIVPFPPGHVEVYDLDKSGKAWYNTTIPFNRPGQPPIYDTLAVAVTRDVHENVRTLLQAAVKKRMMSDRRIGCLLSGGLDSSLVSAILVKLSRELNMTHPIQSFAVGMEGSPDIVAARKVARHLRTEHHEVIFTSAEGLEVLPDVIKHLESYDITTIRASVGMYLLSRYIKENTNSTVIFSGEGSDEVTQGYIYFHKAPSSTEADKESHRLLRDLYFYDVLRVDRMTSAWGLEARIPFLDHQFSSYYLSLPADARQPKNYVEKHLLRSAFDDGQLLPNDILWRPKEAFSDGVSSIKHSWFEVLQEFCDKEIKDEEMEAAATMFSHNIPKTKEAMFYRKIFESKYPNKGSLIPYFWMPRWSDTIDPSARTLAHYKQ